ncbi:MAG: HPF/RaiA family ribosome-associated protein [Candidatus Omnitrophica bacterium]|nr:HPF/RaiA family ribosome-associated protein [Candidatus Omnitrophota bacterium]
MRIDISLKNIASTKVLQDILEKDISKVKRRVRMLKKDEALHLIISGEKNPHKELFSVSLKLFLPHKTIKVEEENKNLAKAFNGAFAALVKQIDKYKHMLERHLDKKRTFLTK